MYLEDETEKEAIEYQARRMSKPDDSLPAEISKEDSMGTSTSQSTQTSRQTSLEVSPIMTASLSDSSTLDPVKEGSVTEGRGVYSGGIENIEPLDGDRKQPAYSSIGTRTSLPTVPMSGGPANFGVIVPGVYRSSFPKAEDYPFIEGLKLKTIVTLVQKDFPEDYVPFISKNGIKHHVFDMKGTKKEEIPIRTMKAILRLVLNQQNHPLLIHCNHGKHRTGCVVGIVRKVSGWDLDSVLTEYKSFAEPKVRECDVKYISGFELADISNLFVKEMNWRYRAHSFLRATLFTLFVLSVCFYSGKRIQTTSMPHTFT